MSLSHFQEPFEVARHPQLEPEVKRAILASWASDANAVEGNPAVRRPPRHSRSIPVDEILDALRAIDRSAT